MNKAVILHGTGSSHTSNWFPWVKAELEKIGYEVWVPDLPDSDHPNAEVYNQFLLSQGWDFNNNLLIGHSSGAVSILNLLPALPKGTKVDTAILVGSFSEVLASEPDWEQLKGLFLKPFDFETIKARAKRFVFIHSDNDPYCPIEQARYLHQHIGGEFVMIKGGQHFSRHLDPKYRRFPELLEIIKQKFSSPQKLWKA